MVGCGLRAMVFYGDQIHQEQFDFEAEGIMIFLGRDLHQHKSFVLMQISSQKIPMIRSDKTPSEHHLK